MKLEFKKENLQLHINNIQRGITSLSHLPVLEGMMITATKSNVTLLTSDNNLSIKDVIEAPKDVNVIEAGKVLVPGRLFKDVIDKQGKDIALETNDNQMIITSDGSETKINLFNENDYPNISFDTTGKDLVIDVDVLRSIIKNVSFASATEDRRIILNGVNLVAKDKKIIASATNTFRMATEEVEIKSTVDFNITILAKKLKNFLPPEAKGEIIINVDDSKIISKIGNTMISSKLLDGIYPPVEKLIVDDYLSVYEINSEQILESLERVTVVSGQGNKIVQMTIDNNGCLLESKKGETGSSKANLGGGQLKGEDISIIFDAAFFKEAVDKFKGNIKIKFNGPHKPFIISGEKNTKLIQLILPHRSF